MKLQHLFIAAVGSIAPLFTLLPPFMPIASAQQPTQQRILRGECTSLVIGEERGSRINMRSGPGIDFDNPDYVLVGQVVNELIDSVSYRTHLTSMLGLLPRMAFAQTSNVHLE